MRRTRDLCRMAVLGVLLSQAPGCGGGGESDTTTPSPNTQTVGGTVSGLAGTGLVLQVNGKDDLAVSADGPFTFATPLANSSTYNVSILRQPTKPTQVCAVARGNGTISSRTITDVAVTCITQSYAVGGIVSGLTGTLVVRNNSTDELTITSDGSFVFAGRVQDGQTYQVSVVSQPAGQQCSVTTASGTIDSADVTSVRLVCASSATHFMVGGTVTGLVGSGLVLQNNGGDDLVINESLPFTFASSLRVGEAFNITVRSAPAGHQCNVLNGTGNVGTANVTNVQVTCSFALTIGYRMKQLTFSWPSVSGATSYQLLGSDGTAPYTQIRSLPGSATSTELDIAVHQHAWASARYRVRACSASCADSNEVSTAGASARAVGYFKASNTGVFDDFGSSVAISGDGSTMAVGAPQERSAATGVNGDETDDSARDSGAVYIFSRQADGWVQQAYIKASNTQGGDQFGAAIALSEDGNTLVVGAPEEDSAATGINGNQADDSALQSGAAYVYTRVDTEWSQQAYLKASNAEEFDNFGRAVALSGDGATIAVGAPSQEGSATGVNGDQHVGFVPAAGAVYVFVLSGSAWVQQAYVKASNTGELDSFGSAIALNGDGNTMVVGAPLERSSATGINGNQADNSAGLVGAAYVFTRAAGAWTQQAYIKPSNTRTDGRGMSFGSALGLSADGNTLAVGAHGEDSAARLVDGDQFDRSAFSAGAVYLFSRSMTQWTQQAYIKASNTDPEDHFGSVLGLSSDGRSLAVGSTVESSPATGVNGDQGNDIRASYSGAVYFYTNVSGAWGFRSYVKASNTDHYTYFGATIGLSADGSVLAIGSPGEQSQATGIGGDQRDTSMPSGAVYLY